MPHKRNTKKKSRNSTFNLSTVSTLIDDDEKSCGKQDSKLTNLKKNNDSTMNPSESTFINPDDENQSTVSNVDSALYTKEGLRQCMENKLAEIENKALHTRERVMSIFETMRLSMEAEDLKVVISLEKEIDYAAIVDGSLLSQRRKDQVKNLMTPVTMKKRRSRSIDRNSLPKIMESPKAKPRRSSSADGNRVPFQTPMQRILAHKIMTAHKYTVRKPCPTLNSGVSMERAMRPGESAISTDGSPLFVSRVPCVPEVNIPMTNGMIISIDTENPSRKINIPQLDDETKVKIKVLCEKLRSIAEC